MSTWRQFIITLIVLSGESSGYLGVNSIIVIGDSKQKPAEAGPYSYQGCCPTARLGEESHDGRWERHAGDISSSSLAPPRSQDMLASNIL